MECSGTNRFGQCAYDYCCAFLLPLLLADVVLVLVIIIVMINKLSNRLSENWFSKQFSAVCAMQEYIKMQMHVFAHTHYIPTIQLSSVSIACILCI